MWLWELMRWTALGGGTRHRRHRAGRRSAGRHAGEKVWPVSHGEEGEEDNALGLSSELYKLRASGELTIS